MTERKRRWQPKRVREGLDSWFVTVAHYAGIGLFVYALAVDQFRTPSLLPTALGLILLRNVAGSG